MTKRTIFISDIHMSIDADTNWWQHTVHKKALKGVLKYAQDHAAEMADFVVLGDWFDQWTYSPGSNPASVKDIMDKHIDLFTPAPDGSGDFITLMRTIGGKLRYINGNHDMLVSLADINAWLRDHKYNVRIFPGSGGDLQKPPLQNTLYTAYDNKIYGEHGHLYDLFNKPFENSADPYDPLPVGHFITRTAGEYVLEQLKQTGKQNSAQLPGSGDPNYSNFGMDLEVIVRTVKELIERGERPNIAEIALDAVLAFAKKSKVYYNMDWYKGGRPSSDEVDNYYPGLISIDHLVEDLEEAAVNFTGLKHFAEKILKNHPATRIVVMGHTHHYLLDWSGKSSDPVYINSGFNCAAEPDMKDKKRIITCVEVAADEGKTFTVNEKIIDFETGAVNPGDSAVISWT